MKEQLIEKALNQVVKDVESGDLTAIEELLKFVPNDKLDSFLSEE